MCHTKFTLVNLRVKPWPDHFVYVGREFACFEESHELANPFPLKVDTPENRAACLDAYRGWLNSLPDRDERLWRLMHDTEGGRFPIACWCGTWDGETKERPLCHGAVLIDEMRKKWVCLPHDENA
jgi:hypothetical protein